MMQVEEVTKHVSDQEIVERFLQLRGRVATRIRKLAEMFNLPRAQIYRVLKSHGYFCEVCGEYTTFKHDEAVECYRTQRVSIEKLAEMFNTSYFTMYTVLKNHGVDTRRVVPKLKKLVRVGSRRQHYRINIPISYIKELGFRGDEELYGKWVEDSGVLRLVISDREMEGEHVYKLTYSGKKTKDGVPSTRSIFLPAKLVKSKGQHYELAVANGTIVVSFRP